MSEEPTRSSRLRSRASKQKPEFKKASLTYMQFPSHIDTSVYSGTNSMPLKTKTSILKKPKNSDVATPVDKSPNQSMA